jgi:hypothetical protein
MRYLVGARGFIYRVFTEHITLNRCRVGTITVSALGAALRIRFGEKVEVMTEVV